MLPFMTDGFHDPKAAWVGLKTQPDPSDSDLTCRLGLQQKAIENARSAIAKLPYGDALFENCIKSKDGVGELSSALKDRCAAHDKKRLRIVRQFEKSTAWLRNFSAVVDIVMQTQAGIGCPVWAPIKLVLMVRLMRSDLSPSVCLLPHHEDFGFSLRSRSIDHRHHRDRIG
jgi:hypothetical protein